MLNNAVIENPEKIISWWTAKIESQKQYIYQSLFESTYNAYDTTNLILDGKEIGRMSAVTAVDGKSIKLPNNSLKDSYKLLPFKYYKEFDENLRQDIDNAITQNFGENEINSMVNDQYRNISALLTFAYDTRERLAIQELTTGKIEIKGVDDHVYVRDFKMPSEHKDIQVRTTWGTKNATPIADIQENMDKISDDNGATIGIIIMNRKTFINMAKSGEVITTMIGRRANENIILSREAVTTMMKDILGVKVIIYNKSIGADWFLPDDVVILAPSGSLGRMVWTNTNEGMSLVEDPTVQISKTMDGLTIYTDRIHNPVVTHFHTSQYILPVLDQVKNIMTLKVGATSNK